MASGSESKEANGVYRPLNTSDQEIRVLDILPFSGTQYENLRCQLRHSSLDADPRPSYETISYCWGDPNPLETIILDGHVFRVPTNTYLALRRCASPTSTRTVWIDAVCINQQDLQERSQQVTMMGLIYSQTASGIVYLGEGDSNFRNVLASLEGIAKEARAAFTREELRNLTIPERKPWATNAERLRTPFDLNAMTAFFACPWFRRLWILQEAVLPSHSVCLYGGSQIDLDTLLDAGIWMSHHFPFIGIHLQLSEGREAARRTWDLRTMKSRSGVFAELMMNTRATLTSDPRDRVFGLLGLIDLTGQMPDLLRSDYAKSVEDVVRDGVRYCIEVERYPFIWKEISYRTDEEVGDPKWPSWVPRMNRPWSSTEDAVELPHNEDEIQERDALQSNAAIPPSPDPNILHVKGTILSTIKSITPTLLTPLPHTTEILHSSLQHILALTTQPPETDTALHRTLTADLDYRRARNTASTTSLAADFAAYKGWTLDHHDANITYARLNLSSEEVEMRSSRYYAGVDAACTNRRFCVTEDGRYGLVPKVCRTGDCVVLMGMLRKPVALRRMGESWLVLGECYFDGGMWMEDVEGLRGEEVVFEIC